MSRYVYKEKPAHFDDYETHRMIESYLNQDELDPGEAAFLRGYYSDEL